MVIASNRDEFFARPAAPPTLFESLGKVAFAAPQDLQAGGTWMGINARGLFVGLTNRPVDRKDARRRSRGLLVADALECPSAEAAIERLGEDLTGRYNPFHLLVADGRRSFLLRTGARDSAVRALDPGVQVIGNLDEDDPKSKKLGSIREDVERIDPNAPFEAILERLVEVLSDHRHLSNRHENACVHTPDYGTRSSAIIALGPQRRTYWATDGPPCRAKYHDYTRLLDALQQAGSNEAPH